MTSIEDMPPQLERKRIYHVIGEDRHGQSYSVGYYINFSDARNASKGCGCLEGDAEIETESGIVVNGMHLYIEETEQLLPLFHDDLNDLKVAVKKELDSLRRSASQKLNLAERLALGL